MKFAIEDSTDLKTFKDASVSIPKTLYSSKVLSEDIELNAGYVESAFQKNTLLDIWGKQHPLIHTWLILSSVSICFLSALLLFW